MSSQPVHEDPVLYPMRKPRSVFSRIGDRIASFVTNFNFKAFLFSCIVLPLMTLVYLTVIADGWRIAFDGAANKKLYKTEIAVLTGWHQYEVAHRLDVASCCAAVMMIMVWLAATRAMKIVLCNKGYKKGLTNAGVFRRFLVTSALGLLVFDSYLFYQGIAATNWGSDHTAKPIMAALGWALVLSTMCFFHVTLKLEDTE